MAGIGRDEIASGLRSLGLRRQSTVVVHSSLRSFGAVEGGAQAVAAALAERICAGWVNWRPVGRFGSYVSP